MSNLGAEKTFENKVKDYIEDHNGWQVKFFANRMTKRGIPDILSNINGYFVAIEVKAENGEPSELQKYHRRKINETGGIAIILYPSQYGQFKQLVKCLNENNKSAALQLASLINERS